jgi:hypothetical protein
MHSGEDAVDVDVPRVIWSAAAQSPSPVRWKPNME